MGATGPHRSGTTDTSSLTDGAFRAAFDSMPDSLAIFSAVREADGEIVDFRCEYLNPAAAQWTGAEPSALVGHRLLEMLPSYRGSALFDDYCRVVEEGETLIRSGFDFEDQFIGGRYQQGAYDGWASKLGDGMVLAWREVTARKRDAEALRASEELFRGVFHRSAVGMALLDSRGRCLRANAALGHLLGLAPQELEGHSFERYVHPEDQACFGQRCGAAPPEIAVQAEVRCRRADGKVVWTLMSCAEAASEASPDSLRVLQVVDIGPRKEAEAELARSNADLEQFAYAASHDLQEPLRMVTGYLQLLERRHAEQLDGEAAEYIGFAVDGAGRMKELIQGLLTYCRAGTQQTALAACELETVVDRVLGNLGAAIAESQAQITRDPLPVVLGDQTQLVQLLQNLLGNAIKFRHPDRRVTVHLTAEADDGQAVLSIADNGIGIEPAHLAAIFQPFRRLHTRQDYPGSGMGLAIVERIVQRHGGAIEVASQPGAGTRFTVRLPLGS
ncbi:MAG: PAS domain S-box protein, partial [Armatimonadetes bacterium]|nr:PAS domain S-box protein [Armatimonadota bacterium]